MLKKTRVAVFVSGGGSNLEALLQSEVSGGMPFGEIALVVSNTQGAYALERANNHGVEGVCIPSRGNSGFEEELQALLMARHIDIIVLAGFLAILSADFVGKWPERIINIHPSLIPSFCGKGFYGLKVHEAALERGVTLTGATVHLVNEIPDGGRILLQKAVEIRPDDTAKTLQQRVMEQAEWVLLPQATAQLCQELSEKLSEGV
ncbi:phosphoribosylglycinamide formyltransferase [Bengtsoniella intestinalis]|uniref:phosphoribosylglycinamide formyltransferase n=1 Tax=Bengtsoniella intestinalis TaxID=3073143 RepID=UPI00391F1360